MNSILNQRKEISDLQKELQSKNSKLQSIENFVKNLNPKSSKNNIDFISEIEKHKTENNKLKGNMHNFIYQIKNIIESNEENFMLSELAKSEIELKNLDEKYEFYYEELFNYIKYLKRIITNNNIEKEDKEKTVQELKTQIIKHNEIFKDGGLDSKSKFFSSSSQKISDENVNDLNSAVLKNQNSELNLNYNKMNKELESLMNKNTSRSQILLKMSESAVLGKDTIISSFQTVGKKRSHKLKDSFSFISEAKAVEEGTDTSKNLSRSKERFSEIPFSSKKFYKRT